MPLSTGESGESGEATPKLADDAHSCFPSLTPLTLAHPLVTHWSQQPVTHLLLLDYHTQLHPGAQIGSFPYTILKYESDRDPEECVPSFHLRMLEADLKATFSHLSLSVLPIPMSLFAIPDL